MAPNATVTTLHPLAAPVRAAAVPPKPRQAPAMPPATGALRFLAHYVMRHRAMHLVVLGSVLLAVICSVATQYGLKNLIDTLAPGPAAVHPAALWGAFAVLCALIAADNLLWRVGGLAAARGFVAVTGDVRRDLFAHLSGHSPSYFAERLPGTLAGRISATASAAFTVENTTAWNVLPPCIGVFCSVALIGTVAPGLAAVLLVLAGSLGGLIFYLAKGGTPHHRAYAGEAASVDGELVDIVANMGVVRAFGATLRERGRFAERVGAEMSARRGSLFYLERLRLIHAVLTALLSAGVVGFGLVLWQHGRASVGDIVLITSLAFNILHGTRDLAVALADLTQHVARLEEAVTALMIPHELPDCPDAQHLQLGAGRIDFRHVHFAYPGRDAVLNDFDMTIAPGQRVGLVGFSGAGKSTVLALLQRFYDVQSGEIVMDGQNIAAVTQESLRQSMAIVPQDVSLFHRSVLENIRYARPDATEAEVLAAAEMAHCRDFIEDMPEGFNTMVGDRGVKLSGGQRQRLAIARALLKDAPILLLDEATSALDSESERAIQVALDRLMRGRTVVAIAHRLSTLQSFDRIIVMDRGRIVEDGSPHELAMRPGPYRDLLQRQNMDADALAA